MPGPDAAIVGRGAELEQAGAVLAGALGGHAAALVVDGDAGVGKTRLAVELAAGVGDALVLMGHCVDLGDTPPPYLPLTEAFTRLPAPRADELVARYPPVARLLQRHGSASAGDARIDRGAMLDAVLAALSALAEEQPVLLVVEDLHWADMATRDLLGYVFTRMTDLPGVPLAVLATVRSDDLNRRHPLRAALAGWSRLSSVHRLHLGPLSSGAVRDLIRGLDATIAEASLTDIVRRADGNAFFAEELLDTTRQDTGELPWALADLLLVRLDPLGDDAAEIVRVAAVAGRSVAHELLVDVVELPLGRADAALREAVDAFVLHAAPDARGRPGYRFRHALLGEAVYDDLLPGERVRIHAAYAASLGGQDDVSAAELARHARAAHDLPVAYTAAVRAADQALAVGAPFEALQHLQSALELFTQLPEPPGDHTQLVLTYVDAAIAAGRSRRALRVVRTELKQLTPDVAPHTRAALLYGLAKAALAGEFDGETTAAVSEAMQLTDDEPVTELRAELLGLRARMAASMGRLAEAERAAHDAIELAAGIGARPALISAQSTLAMLQRRLGDPARAVEMLAVAAEDARRAGDHATEIRTLFSRASALHEQGRLDAAQDGFDTVAERGTGYGRSWDLYTVHSRAMGSRLRYGRGDWDAAMRVLDTSDEQPPPVSAAILDAASLFVRAGRDEPDVLDRAAALRPFWVDEGRIALCVANATIPLLGQRDRVEEALALVDEVVGVLGRIWMEPWFLARLELSARMLDVLARGARTAGAARRVELLSRGRRFLDDAHECVARGVPRGSRMGAEGVAWQARLTAGWAALRWVAGTDAPTEDELVTAWRAAESTTGYQGNTVELARVRTDLAGILRATGRKDDAAATAALARPIGVATGDVLVRNGLRTLSVPQEAPGAGGQPLTPREHEVLSLVAEGRSNRQIGARLFISEKTVSVHVSNILAKLGVRGRTEAAATARRTGLLD